MKSIGGSTVEEALESLNEMTEGLQPIGIEEYRARLNKAGAMMRELNWKAMLLVAGTNMSYFTGTEWNLSERLVGVLVFADGSLIYIAPEFEKGTIDDFMVLPGEVATWQEHESPYALVAGILAQRGINEGSFGMDEAAPFFVSNGVAEAAPNLNLLDAAAITASCRMIKSEAEIAIMQRAMDMTMAVQRATGSILHEGISTTEVCEFIDRAHRKVGAPAGNYFVIVLFGVATSFPHGVKEPQILKHGDNVIVDTGCQLHGYISDITRSYVFGQASDYQREVWEHEKGAQLAAFEGIKKGATTADLDLAARDYLEKAGYGPNYQLPGLPHRTGHGIGLAIHEWPYLVSSSTTELVPGICASIEPMLVIDGVLGVRLEDHFYITEDGPKWFTEPAHSIEHPFGPLA